MEPSEPMHVHSGACHVKGGVAVWVAVFDLGWTYNKWHYHKGIFTLWSWTKLHCVARGCLARNCWFVLMVFSFHFFLGWCVWPPLRESQASQGKRHIRNNWVCEMERKKHGPKRKTCPRYPFVTSTPKQWSRQWSLELSNMAGKSLNLKRNGAF